MDSKRNQIDPSTVFVVSGGARGVTAKCVIELAQQYHCKFILLGRSEVTETEPAWAESGLSEAQLKKRIMEHLTAQGEKPTPVKVQKLLNAFLARSEIRQTLEAIAKAGGQAEYLSVDITDGSALQQKLAEAAQRTGQITGIIHGAGNLADKLIENKSAEDFETVYSAKVIGLQNLLNCVPLNQLDYLALFSSAAGFFGNAGQADYAIANEILNKTAYLVKQQHPNCHVVSLNWGPWDGGMVTPALKEFFAKRHIEIIPIEAGAKRLVSELSPDNQETVQVLVGSSMDVGEVQLDPELRTFNLRRKLTLEGNPFLYDHRIGGHPVLPAICVVNWVANAAEQLYPGYKFFSTENSRVLKGVVFDNSQVGEYNLELKEIAKDANEIIFDGTITSKNEKGKTVYHYGVRLKLLHQIPVLPPYTGFESRFDKAVQPGSVLYQSGILFHGPSFQGVRQVLNISPEKMTTECYLSAVPEKVQGQFPVQTFNPYAVDVQLQCLLIWSRHFYEAGSLPLKIQKIEHYRTIPFNETFYASMEVQNSSETGLVATVIAHDARGEIYTRIEGAEVTISKRLNALFTAANPTEIAPIGLPV